MRKPAKSPVVRQEAAHRITRETGDTLPQRWYSGGTRHGQNPYHNARNIAKARSGIAPGAHFLRRNTFRSDMRSALQNAFGQIIRKQIMAVQTAVIFKFSFCQKPPSTEGGFWHSGAKDRHKSLGVMPWCCAPECMVRLHTGWQWCAYGKCAHCVFRMPKVRRFLCRILFSGATKGQRRRQQFRQRQREKNTFVQVA